MIKQQSIWNAQAEAVMMGMAQPIESEQHLKHLVGYILYTLQGQYSYDLESKTDEVVENALHKYNSDKTGVSYLSISSTSFGVLLTFVRDSNPVDSPDGVLAWVENLDAPFCSELGYVYFEKQHGRIRRIA